MVISQGEVWWADLGEPTGSEPGYRRPVLVVQGDPFNRSTIATVVSVALTSTLRWEEAPGNVRLSGRSTGLPRDSVANVSQLVTLDKSGSSFSPTMPRNCCASSLCRAGVRTDAMP